MNNLDSQERAAHIQGRWGFAAAVVAAIISGIFNIMCFNYIHSLINDIDNLNTENKELSDQMYELNSESTQYKSDYAALQKQYDQLNKEYVALNGKYTVLLDEVDNNESITEVDEKDDMITASTAKTVTWLDNLDYFYMEKTYKDGSVSDGWHRVWQTNSDKDSLGNDHQHGIYIRAYRDDTYVLEYILDDTYVGFSGLFTLDYDSRNIQIDTTLKIYSIDNNREKTLLYESDKPLSGGIRPIEFDFGLKGATDIWIEVSSGAGDNGEFFVALVDSCFYK